MYKKRARERGVSRRRDGKVSIMTPKGGGGTFNRKEYLVHGGGPTRVSSLGSGTKFAEVLCRKHEEEDGRKKYQFLGKKKGRVV